MNHNSRLWRQPFEQGSEAFWLQGDASRRRSKSHSGEVDEHGATAASDPRPGIVVNLHDEVVEMILPPQPIARRSIGTPNRPVVAPVGRVLAPGVRRANPSHRQTRAGPRAAVGPPPNAQRAEAAAWGCPVAFDFIRLDAAAPERHLQTQRPGDEPSPAPVSYPGRYRHPRKGASPMAKPCCEHRGCVLPAMTHLGLLFHPRMFYFAPCPDGGVPAAKRIRSGRIGFHSVILAGLFLHGRKSAANRLPLRRDAS
jgi:hypothetical protein